MLVKYNTIRDMDISNGEGIACSIFFQGCSHHCEGCFNPETWSFDTGKEFTEEVQHKFIEMCKKPYIKCISLLGGEPFDQDSYELYNFLKRLKQEVNKPVYLWTGYLYEELLEKDCNIKNIFEEKLISVLIDGEFILQKRDLMLKLRGSSNQRVIRLNGK